MLVNNINVDVYNGQEFFRLVYGSGGLPKIRGLYPRIPFFDYRELDMRYKHDKIYYLIIKEDDLIVAICKLGEYENGILTWSYNSVDFRYRNKGYGKTLVEASFILAKEKNYKLKSSTYSVLGYERLHKYKKDLSKKYDVEYIYDEDAYFLDNENHYLIHKGVKMNKNYFDRLKKT